MLSSPSPSPETPAELLYVDADATAAEYLPALRDRYLVTAASSASWALRTLERTSPALVITELDLSDGPAVEICRRAKTLPKPASVLVTTRMAERVPDALMAGCDGVLLKPFQPNLLFARVGLMLRGRSSTLLAQAQRGRAKSAHLAERADQAEARAIREWPHTHCPYCNHAGVTSFEHASHRREWYACLSCRKVWMAKRQE